MGGSKGAYGRCLILGSAQGSSSAKSTTGPMQGGCPTGAAGAQDASSGLHGAGDAGRRRDSSSSSSSGGGSGSAIRKSSTDRADDL